MSAAIGKEIDVIRKLQIKRDVFETKSKALEKQIKELQLKLLTRLKKSKLEGASGRLGRAEIDKQDVPTIEDFDLFVDYAVNKNARDLLYKRVSKQAAQARWDQGVKIPGVTKFPYEGVKVSAIKKKR